MGKKEILCWAALCISAGLVLLGIFIWKFPTSSSEWAAWVQAIGTVGALGIAIWVSAKQSKLTRAIHKTEVNARAEAERKAISSKAADRRAWCDAVIAMVESVAEEIHKAEQSIEDFSDFIGYPAIERRSLNELQHFRASVAALRTISLPKLASYDAVLGVMGLANEAELILHYLDKAESAVEGTPNDGAAEYIGLIRAPAFRALGHYERAVRPLGGEPKERLTQYRM